MKKIIVISLVTLVLLLTLGVIYLNNVYLPKTIKALIIRGIEEKTNSRVTLGSLKVNIFKGLVLTDLGIYQQEDPVLKIKEASCIVLPIAFLRKQLIIPNINIKSAQVFLERKKDNTFNLEDLIPPEPAGGAAADSESAKTAAVPSKGFTVSVYRVNISNARITFQDSTFAQPFSKTVENFNLTAYLSLPASVKFKLSGLIASSQPMKLIASGEFKIPKRELNAKLNLLNFSPNEFSAYYQGSGLNLTEGLLNASADLKMKDNVIYADCQAEGNNLNILKENIAIKANIGLRTFLEYNLNGQILKYSGSGSISDTLVSGIEFVDEISEINAAVTFNNSGLNAENLTANILGLPVRAKVTLNNFSDPELNMNAISSLTLEALQGLLKDKFKYDFPGTMDGQGELSLEVKGKLFGADNLAVSGQLELNNAQIKLQSLNSPIQEINGKIGIFKDRLHWEGLYLRFKDVLYETSGSLMDFKSPILDISIKSDDILLSSVLNFNGKLIKVSKCSGRYLNSEFFTSGDIDNTVPSGPKVDLTGELLIDLKDLKKPLSKFKEQLDKINPEGKVNAEFNFSGNINDLVNCVIGVEISGDSVSLYGLKGKDLFINYIQSDGLASVSSMRLSLYGGALNGFFRTNLRSKDYSYLFDANVADVKIEELKLDTPAKSKDIAGIIQGEVRVSGSLGDITGSQGSGKVAITKGRLWELDLFKGMGKLLFSQDLASIVFSEGSCEFAIRDKAIFSDNLVLKSDMINLSGPVKIGFDSSISANLNVNILSEFVPLTGTFKDVTTAILGQSGRFAVIKVSGTLKEPKYKFTAAAADIFKGLANTFLNNL